MFIVTNYLNIFNMSTSIVFLPFGSLIKPIRVNFLLNTNVLLINV